MSQENQEKRDAALDRWFDGVNSDNYRQRAKYSMQKFFRFLTSKGWTDISGDLILQTHLENRKSDDKQVKYYFDDLLPRFVKWLKDGGLAHNSACTTANTIRGFFKFHREPLQINGKIKEIEKAKTWHSFSKDELSKMVSVGDLEEKAVIMLGKDLGLRVGDFVMLMRKPLEEAYKDQKGAFPLEFQAETKKHGVVAVGHVLKETWNMLQLYWKTTPASEYVFPTSTNGRAYISKDRANDVLKNTWSKAFPDRNDVKIRWHELRSFKMSVLSNCGVNQWHIKKMVGKKISSDIATYLTGINLKDSFRKAEQALSLTQGFDHAAEEIQNLKEKMQQDSESFTQSIKDVAESFTQDKMALKTTVNALEKQNRQLNERLSKVEQQNVTFQKVMDLAFYSIVEHVYLVEQLASERGVSVEEVLGLNEEQKAHLKRVMTADQQELEAWIIELNKDIKKKFHLDPNPLENEADGS